MISTFDNCLYIHIPKTAGQSIESVFLERAGLSWDQREAMLLKPNSNPTMGPPRLAHLTAQEYTQLGYLSEQQFNSLFKFTIVRNPWDRLVSEYRYKRHKFSFKDFIFNRFPKEGEDDYQEFNGIYRHVMPQYQFIYDENKQLMVDYVGKFETLQKDFSIISQKVFGQALDLPHKNKTQQQSIINRISPKFKKNINGAIKKQHYSHYYDDETREWVSKLYARDIALFDYQF